MQTSTRADTILLLTALAAVSAVMLGASLITVVRVLIAGVVLAVVVTGIRSIREQRGRGERSESGTSDS